MENHPSLKEGNAAVITGGADGIGLAAAQYYLSLGMRICLADIDEEKLAEARNKLGDVLTITVDVSSMDDMQRLKDKVYTEFGQVDILMNNAGSAFFTRSLTNLPEWRKTLEVNLWGVINGIHALVPAMIEQGTPGLVINTGSKQGITTPPGDSAYNVSKAGVKAVTEALQHELRNLEGCQVSAHLLVPGMVYTGIFRRFMNEKPDSAWTADQVIDYMLPALARGDFYIICPDNEVTEEIDRKRMEWAMGDLVHNRPALSRWHPDYQDEFTRFMKEVSQ